MITHHNANGSGESNPDDNHHHHNHHHHHHYHHHHHLCTVPWQPPRATPSLGAALFWYIAGFQDHDAKICLHLGDAMTAWTKMELEELQ